MGIFFISDTHFCSDNIIKYCGRPFKDAADMNEKLIQNWNSVVGEDDLVYHLGDFVMHQSENIPPIVERLNGRIVLVRGNHDTRAKLEVFRHYPDKIDVRDIAYVPFKGIFLVACHMPMTNPAFLDMVNTDNSEVVPVHGHVHDKVPFFTQEFHSFNVSADVINFTPVPIQTIYKTVKQHFIEKGVWTGKVIE